MKLAKKKKKIDAKPIEKLSHKNIRNRNRSASVCFLSQNEFNRVN